jgi:hypothetical protein
MPRILHGRVDLWRAIKQQLGHAFVAAVGNGAAGGGPGEQALLDLDALQFTRNHFGCYVRLVHRLVRQHGLVSQ